MRWLHGGLAGGHTDDVTTTDADGLQFFAHALVHVEVLLHARVLVGPPPPLAQQRQGLASALPSSGSPTTVFMARCLSDLIGGPPKQYKLPALPDWFHMLNAECFEHVRSFLDFDQKLVVCQVSKAWNKPLWVKVWRTGYGKNRLRYSLPPLGCFSGILREPATERQRLLQAVVKIQRYWLLDQPGAGSCPPL
eukprot:COSAG01_NODE_940_length_12584_cov_7.454218_7_plen_193_part_00